MNHIVGVIFARGGSKGIPRKNLRLLAGKPLLAHSIDTARSCDLLHRVIVSTDDPETAEAASAHGAEALLHPTELARDELPEWPAWRHAILALEAEPSAPRVDVLVSIPTTSPLRVAEDIARPIRLLLESDADGVITVTESGRNPYFNMVALDVDGYARLAIPRRTSIHVRQRAPTIYDMTTVAYVMRRDFVLEAKQLFDGRIRAVVAPPEHSIDVDTELDLFIADILLRNRLTVS